jgi:hypothetical protein
VGQQHGLLDRAAGPTGRFNIRNAWLGRTASAVFGNSQTNRPLAASCSPRAATGASPSQPPPSVLREIGVVHMPVYIPGPCHR